MGNGVKPRVPITDPAFVYVPASHTDIRKTFERVRQEQKPRTPLKRKLELRQIVGNRSAK